MKEKRKNLLLIAIAVLFAGYLSVTGIADLTNQKDLHHVTLGGAFDLMEIEHSINGLIPVGKDYYYIGFEAESGDAYLIHAPKNWLKKNFDDSGYALEEGGLAITALSKRLNYKIAMEAASMMAQMENTAFPQGADYCLELSYRMDAIQRLAALAALAVLAAVGFVLAKSAKPVSVTLKRLYLVAWILALMFTLSTLI